MRGATAVSRMMSGWRNTIQTPPWCRYADDGLAH